MDISSQCRIKLKSVYHIQNLVNWTFFTKLLAYLNEEKVRTIVIHARISRPVGEL